MRSKLFLAALFMLILPLFNSPLKVSSSISATPYSGIAFAGHTLPGNGWCECDCPECHGVGAVARSESTSEEPQSDVPSDTDSGIDALMTALLVILWIRFGA
jgi:hypothetical protein